ncbi:MAG: type secretion protein Rhs, partial [Bacteroidetes bacterium]|nr:type secretion protein Rhs [Bacteroidota bacterium]
ESFSWDVKGNMVAHRSSSNEWRERYLCWTEDNRLQAVKDNQMGAYYNYDASGERNLKLTGAVVQMSQNGVPYDYVMLESPTLYASGLITINEKGYTKHYFEENKRVCSNIGGGFRYAGYEIMDSIELITPFLEQWRNAKEGIFKTFDECIKSPVDLENTTDKIVKVMKDHEKNRNEAEYQFYYTNDHLGSSTYITNQQGQITQTLAYLPYGEDWVDLDNQPPYITQYKFNGKEKDQETSYQYFGARYQSPKLSIWLSVDPLSDKYPHLTSYNYCANNPVMLIDPDGREIYLNGEGAEKAFSQLQSALKTKLHRDGKTGLISVVGDVKGRKNSREAKLIGMITDKEIKVNINTTNGKKTSEGDDFSIGAFMGNSVKSDGTVETYQAFNANEAADVDKDLNAPGSMIMHEISESYYGGVMSLATGVSAKKSTRPDDFFYNFAHNMANKISNGNIKFYYDTPIEIKTNWLMKINGKYEYGPTLHIEKIRYTR